MAVFEREHQDTIDMINDAGWKYVARRAKSIVEEYGAKGGLLTESSIGIQVKGVEVILDRDTGRPRLEWRLADCRLQGFTQGFKLSVQATSESTSNRVICEPFDWYMLCIFLEIGLQMASLGLATPKVT